MSTKRHAVGREPERPVVGQTCTAPACPSLGAPALPNRWVCLPCSERLARRAYVLWERAPHRNRAATAPSAPTANPTEGATDE